MLRWDRMAPPEEGDFLKAGPRVTTSVMAGMEVIHISGGHCSMFSGACYKYNRVHAHPLMELEQYRNCRIYEPTNKKQCVMMFRHVPASVKIFKIVPVSKTVAKVHYALSDNYVCDVGMKLDETMSAFLKKIKEVLVGKNLLTRQQDVWLDGMVVGGMKVKTFLAKDPEWADLAPASKKAKR